MQMVAVMNGCKCEPLVIDSGCSYELLQLQMACNNIMSGNACTGTLHNNPTGAMKKRRFA
jgi:hypothetical protein